MPSVQLNGITLYYEEQGVGEPVLLIPGGGGHALHWIFQMAALAQGYRAISIDNRGAGRSEVPRGPYHVRQMADDAAALLSELGIERSHVVGHSLGAAIAQELALSYPEKIDRMILLGAFARPSPTSLLLLDFWIQALRAGSDPRALWLVLLPWFYTPAFMMQPERVDAVLEAVARDPYPVSPEGLANQVAAAREHNVLDRLGQIGAPTLVLVGGDDIQAPPDAARQIAARIPDALLQVLPHGGHAVQLEYPKEVNEAVLTFLSAGLR